MPYNPNHQWANASASEIEAAARAREQNKPRLTFYKLKLIYSPFIDNRTGQQKCHPEAIISAACSDITLVENLVNKNKGWLKQPARFEIVETRYTFDMNQQLYETDLSYCDIREDL